MRSLSSISGVVLCAGMTAVSVIQANTGGALVFGGMTLSLLCFAFRPKRPAAAETYPLRVMVVWALFWSAAASALVLFAIFNDTEGRALAIAAAIYGVPFAVLLWIGVRRMWCSGHRLTRAQAEDARQEDPDPS